MTRSNTVHAHHPLTRIALVSAGAALALTLAGCGASAGGDAPATVTPGPLPATMSPSATADSGHDGATHDAPAEDADLQTTIFAVSPEQAVTRALGSGGGVVTKIELDHSRDSGAWVYEIDTQNGTEQHEVKVHATSGEVLADTTDTENDPAVEVDLARLSPQDAMAAATALQDGTVSGWTLETDDGVTGYTVEIRVAADDVDVWVGLDGVAKLAD